jgi:hypothetical protein
MWPPWGHHGPVTRLDRVRRRVDALRSLCAVLAGQPLGPGEGIAWPDVVALALEHGIGPALWEGVVAADLVGRLAEEDRHALEWARRRSALTQWRFERQLASVLSTLEAAGVSPVVLKGGALMALTPGQRAERPTLARTMVDLDLLVAAESFPAASAALLEAGYSIDLPGYQPDHATTFVRDGEPGGVDLHLALGVGAVLTALPAPEVIANAETAAVLGVPCQVPSPVDALVHCIVHSELQDHNYRIGAIGLRQLHTFLILFRRHSDPDVWAAVCDRLERAGLGRVASGYAELVRRLFGLRLDRPASSAASRRHARRCLLFFGLGRVTDARLNLIRAFDPPYMAAQFPGSPIWWARTRHAARLLVRRRGTMGEELFRQTVR